MASQRFARLRKIFAGALPGTEEVFSLEGRLERFAHFCALVIRQFLGHRCLVRASALSYSTLLALIPLLVVALSVTSSRLNPQQESELVQFVEKTVSRLVPPAEVPPVGATNFLADTNAPLVWDTNSPPGAVANSAPAETQLTTNTQRQVAGEIHELVQKAGNGALGATGFILLIITAISLLRGIEETFNDIWGVTRGRSWWLQFLLYWVAITIGPLLLSAALGITGSTHMDKMRGFLESSPVIAPLVRHVLPIALLSFTLAFFYLFAPNTKVQFSAAVVGGLCAGAAWHIYNQLGFLLVARAMSASKFYGGVFLIVLLMGGLYILWVILLFGNEIAYAFQNRGAYLQDRLAENVNQRGREFVALRVMTCLGRRFQNGLPPATVPEISTELGVPSRLTQSILRTLAASRLVTEAAGAEAAFLPARPLHAINAHDILLAMRTGAGQELPLAGFPELAGIYGEFTRIEEAERAAASRVTLQALASHGPSEGALATLPTAELPAPSRDVSGPASPMPTVAPEPKAVDLPKAPVQEGTESGSEVKPPRREPVQPNEDTGFPL